MELFSVVSWIYLFIRKEDGVKKTTKVLTLACICCQSCIKLAVIPPQNSFACEKKIQKFATSSIFSKRNQTDSKLPFKGNTKRTCGPFTAVLHVSPWLNNPSDILIKLSSMYTWENGAKAMQAIDCEAFIWIPTWSMSNTLSSFSQSRAGKRQWVMEVQRHASTSNSGDKNIAAKQQQPTIYLLIGEIV